MTRTDANQTLFDLCGHIDSMSRRYLVTREADLLARIKDSEAMAELLRGAGAHSERVTR